MRFDPHKQPGWRRVDARPWETFRAVWAHDSGWTIRHCGHLTANYPYDLRDPAGDRVLPVVKGITQARGFRSLEEAMRHAARLLPAPAAAPPVDDRQAVFPW